MTGLVPGIYVLIYAGKDVDGRDKPGHDESKARVIIIIIDANHSAGLAWAAAAAAARSAAMRRSTMRTDQIEPS